MTYEYLQNKIVKASNSEDLPEEQVDSNSPNVLSVNDLLCLDLDIPDYQRPYKWSIKNISDLFEDISNAFDEREKYGKDYFYRVGTIIIHRDAENNQNHIVDGQQRITSLLLIKFYICKRLDKDISNTLLDKQYSDPEAKRNLYLNYKFICEWFAIRKFRTEEEEREYLEKFLDNFKSVLQVVVLYVDKISEAFQLFDSQNSRGKELDPHDLLKAFHLRAMQNNKYEMERAVNIWEERKSKEIKDLFSCLYNIWNWSRKQKSGDFSTNDIDIFKGIPEGSSYTYARRITRVMPYYQITEPFVMGQDFFELVGHYLNLQSDIKKELKNSYKEIYDVIENNEYNKYMTFKHAKDMFLSVLLCYYDRFHDFSPMAITKLFAWSFMLCIDVPQFDDRTIQKYAIGEQSSGDKYKNLFPMFSNICEARRHTEIEAIHIDTNKEPDPKWKKLHSEINNALGVTSHV